MGRGGIRWIGCGLLLMLVAALPQAASGEGPANVTNCAFDAGSGRVTVTAAGFVSQLQIRRRHGRIIIANLSEFPDKGVLECGGVLKRRTVDSIRVDATGVSRIAKLWLDLGRGRLGPGRTLEESRRASEIEIEFAFDVLAGHASFAALILDGTRGDDEFALGTLRGRGAVNLNPQAERGDEDADVRLIHRPFPVDDAPTVDLDMGAGSDYVSARGEAGVGGALTARAADFAVDMRTGADVFFGSRGRDFVSGGRGHDVLKTGHGNDSANVRGGGADTLDCGVGRDYGFADERDRSTHCELH